MRERFISIGERDSVLGGLAYLQQREAAHHAPSRFLLGQRPPTAMLESVPRSCPNQAFRAHSVPVCDSISLYVSERMSVSDRPWLPWHGRGREFESHQVHQHSKALKPVRSGN